MQCEALKLLYDVRAAFDALIECKWARLSGFGFPTHLCRRNPVLDRVPASIRK